MVVNVFKRSLSFPSKPPNRPSKPPILHHNRSISLPCRSHPLISHLQSEINELKHWSSNSGERNSAWLCDGLTRLKDLHDSFSDLLHLPQTRELLRRRLQWVEKLLDDFLSFIDVYGIFQAELMYFKEQQMAAQLGLRRKDKTKLALYVKARKKMGRDMKKLTSTIRNIGSTTMHNVNMISHVVVVSIGDVQLAEVIEETSEMTKMVSLALVNGIATSIGNRRRYSFWMVKKSDVKKVDESIVEFGESVIFKKVGGDQNEDKVMTLKRMRELNECIQGIENESVRVFRGLINTRVSLLNSLTL